MARALLALIFGLVVAAGLAAASENASTATVQSSGSWNWESGVFTLTLTMPLSPDQEATAPKRRYLAEQEAERHLQQEFVRRAGALPVASGKTLAEVMAADPAVEAGVAQLGESLKFVSSRVDEDYRSLEMVWAVGLWDAVAPLLSEVREANLIPPLAHWAPSRDFSGLVIFAMGDLSWMGTNQKAAWVPSLTFRLLNPQGEVVFDPTMLDPEALARWGQAGMSLGRFNEDRWRDRIGFDPLRIVARAVWGARPGDLVLSVSDWERLLSREANRRLLAEGRILVLYGPFPDYVPKPNPDSAIDPELPPVEVIAQPPAHPAAKAPAGEGEH